MIIQVFGSLERKVSKNPLFELLNFSNDLIKIYFMCINLLPLERKVEL